MAERHQGREFVATEPGQLHIARTDLLEPAGNPLQQPITGLVAVVVVDQLEVVQVHEHQRKTPAQPAIGLQRFHQAITVEQAGQRVVPGQVAVLQLFQFTVSDVAHGEQDLGPLLNVAKLVLKPAHPFEGAALPLGHHFIEAGELLVESLVIAGEELGEVADLVAETHVEMVVAALQLALIVK